MSRIRGERDEIAAAVRQPVTDWIGDAEISSSPKQVSMVVSSRMPAEWTDEIMAEVARRGLTTPSQLIKNLVREGLDRARDGETVRDPEVSAALSHLDAVRRTLIERQTVA
jgi:hypothetical protein